MGHGREAFTGFLGSPCLILSRPFPKACPQTRRLPTSSNASSPKRRARKPKGYWDDIGNIKRELADLSALNPDAPQNQMPTARELRTAGRRDLDNAITKMGGYHKVSQLLGIARSSKKKAPGYWNNFSNLAGELRAFCESAEMPANVMPTQKELRDSKRSDLVEAIDQHGGVSIVAEKLKLGQRVQRKSKHYWKDWSKVESEIRTFVEVRSVSSAPNEDSESDVPSHRRVNSSMPSQGELRAAGRADLAEAITDFHGGFREAARKLGFISKKKDDFFYDDFYNLARELYAFVNEVGQESLMPLTAVLKSEGRTDLAAAISKYGGMSEVSQRLGLYYRVRTREAFKDWGMFRRSLISFMKMHGSLGEIPSSRTLTNFGRRDLYQAILHHGGSTAVADKMGLKRNYWQDFHNVGARLLQFIETHGTDGVMPTERDFLEIGHVSLNVAVSKFGHAQVAKRLGLTELPQSTQVALDTLLNQSLSFSEDDEDFVLDTWFERG